MKINKKNSIIISIVAVIIAILGMLILLNLKDKKSQDNSSKNLENTEVISYPKEDETKEYNEMGWKYYKNEKTGLEFYYPESNFIVETDGLYTILKNARTTYSYFEEKTLNEDVLIFAYEKFANETYFNQLKTNSNGKVNPTEFSKINLEGKSMDVTKVSTSEQSTNSNGCSAKSDLSAYYITQNPYADIVIPKFEYQLATSCGASAGNYVSLNEAELDLLKEVIAGAKIPNYKYSLEEYNTKQYTSADGNLSFEYPEILGTGKIEYASNTIEAKRPFYIDFDNKYRIYMYMSGFGGGNATLTPFDSFTYKNANGLEFNISSQINWITPYQKNISVVLKNDTKYDFILTVGGMLANKNINPFDQQIKYVKTILDTIEFK